MNDLDKLMETAGKNIAALRKRHNWTQTHLANSSGLSQSTIANIENCGNDDLKPIHSPSLKNLVNIANSFNLPLSAIFDANEINIYDECRRLREENTRLTVEMAKANQEMRAILKQLVEKKNG